MTSQYGSQTRRDGMDDAKKRQKSRAREEIQGIQGGMGLGC
jgi:hypothetical protein